MADDFDLIEIDYADIQVTRHGRLVNWELRPARTRAAAAIIEHVGGDDRFTKDDFEILQAWCDAAIQEGRWLLPNVFRRLARVRPNHSWQNWCLFWLFHYDLAAELLSDEDFAEIQNSRRSAYKKAGNVNSYRRPIMQPPPRPRSPQFYHSPVVIPATDENEANILAIETLEDREPTPQLLDFSEFIHNFDDGDGPEAEALEDRGFFDVDDFSNLLQKLKLNEEDDFLEFLSLDEVMKAYREYSDRLIMICNAESKPVHFLLGHSRGLAVDSTWYQEKIDSAVAAVVSEDPRFYGDFADNAFLASEEHDIRFIVRLIRSGAIHTDCGVGFVCDEVITEKCRRALLFMLWLQWLHCLETDNFSDLGEQREFKVKWLSILSDSLTKNQRRFDHLEDGINHTQSETGPQWQSMYDGPNDAAMPASQVTEESSAIQGVHAVYSQAAANALVVQGDTDSQPSKIFLWWLGSLLSRLGHPWSGVSPNAVAVSPGMTDEAEVAFNQLAYDGNGSFGSSHGSSDSSFNGSSNGPSSSSSNDSSNGSSSGSSGNSSDNSFYTARETQNSASSAAQSLYSAQETQDSVSSAARSVYSARERQRSLSPTVEIAGQLFPLYPTSAEPPHPADLATPNEAVLQLAEYDGPTRKYNTPDHPVCLSGQRRQQKGISWLTEETWHSWSNEMKSRLATWGLTEDHVGTCVLIPASWARLRPVDILASYRGDGQDMNEEKQPRLRFAMHDVTVNWARAAAWFNSWPGSPRRGVDLDQFVAGKNGTFTEMHGSHLCHHGFCINPNHVVYEESKVNGSRKSCQGMAQTLRKHSLPIPEVCGHHSPPCLLQHAALTTHETILIQLQILVMACGHLPEAAPPAPTTHSFPTFEPRIPLSYTAHAVGVHYDNMVNPNIEIMPSNSKFLIHCDLCQGVPRVWSRIPFYWSHIQHAHGNMTEEDKLAAIVASCQIYHEWLVLNGYDCEHSNPDMWHKVCQATSDDFAWHMFEAWNVRSGR